MEALKQRIQRDGKIRGNNEVLKVDSFLNHQMDVAFLEEIGREFRRRFAGCQVDRILTIEASGIGIACLAAPAFDHVPVVFAKKNKTKNIDGNVYLSQVESFTQGKRPYPIFVSKEFLHPGNGSCSSTISWPTAAPERPDRPGPSGWRPGGGGRALSLRRPSSPRGPHPGQGCAGGIPGPDRKHGRGGRHHLL